MLLFPAAPHGSAAAGLVPAEGGELDPNTSGDPREGGTPTPPIPPHGSGMVEDEMMVEYKMMEDNMNVEEWIVVQVAPDSADGQQIIGF